MAGAVRKGVNEIPDNGPDRRRAIYEDALAVLHREFAGDPQLDDVGREVGASRRQLQRAFQEAGTSFRTALFEIRMEHAAEALHIEPGKRVREVAASAGYRQPPQFAKAFRRRHGVAPAVWRARSADRA
jgi:AraC family transcriptional regulator of adaptative response / methylphosphotriester-DNA alkyltransferase methyltransferase